MFGYIKNIPYPIWLITCAHAAADLAAGALFVALPFFRAKFGLNYAELTAIVLLQNFTSSVSQPVFGYFSDRKARPFWMPLGCFITGAMMLVSLLVPTYSLVLFCTAVSGLGSAAFHPEGAKMVNRLSGNSKGKGASLFSVGGNAGFAFGSLFLGILLVNSASMWVLFVCPNILISVLLLLAEKQFIRLPQEKSTGKSKLQININFSLFALLGMVLLRSTVNSGISTFVPLYYTSSLHGSSFYAAYLLTVYLAAGAVGTLMGGLLSDRYGSKRVMIFSILPIALLLYLFKMAGGIWVFLLLALVSVLLAATFTSSLVLSQKMMPDNIGMASGLTLGFSIGLGAMGVLALGQVADLQGVSSVFNLLLVLPIFCFVLTLFVQNADELAAQPAISKD